MYHDDELDRRDAERVLKMAEFVKLTNPGETGGRVVEPDAFSRAVLSGEPGVLEVRSSNGWGPEMTGVCDRCGFDPAGAPDWLVEQHEDRAVCAMLADQARDRDSLS